MGWLDAAMRLERKHPNGYGEHSNSDAARSPDVWSNAHDV
jgi:hypothetical protein